jgi:hypothetical protein
MTPHLQAAEAAPRVKIYGERNSGTHYLTRLVAANLTARLLESIEPRMVRVSARYLRAPEVVRDVYFHLTFRRNLGWKHMNPRSPQELTRWGIDRAGLRFLMLTKNPYSWVVSMMRNPYHLGGRAADIDELVRRNWPCRRRENMGRTASSLIDVWCTKTRSYLALSEQAPSCLVRYEDLLVDPAASIGRVAETLGLERRRDTFLNVAPSAKREGRAQSRTFESYRLYYLNEGWRPSLTPTAIATINSQLDADLMHRVGYEIIRSA